ncbi:MAG: hypothetical protein KAW16_07935 [candidate division Zixibacteria bacterium]|nr:hypothetical protein [candidate division Zixibacteria bacterium]
MFFFTFFFHAILITIGSAMLTINRIHICSPINRRPISITMKVGVILVSGGENGQRYEPNGSYQRIERIHPDPAFGGRTD